MRPSPTRVRGSRMGGPRSMPLGAASVLDLASWRIDAAAAGNTAQLAVNVANPGTNDARNGSTTGSDANDVLWLEKAAADPAYCYLPNVAGNSLSIARPYATTHYTIVDADGDTITGTSSANPLVFAYAQSPTIRSITLRETDENGTVGGIIDIEADTTENTGGTFTATQGGTVTVNRSSTGLFTMLVHYPMWLLGGSANYLIVPSYTPTFTDLTCWVRAWTPDATPAATEVFLDGATSDSGLRINNLTTGEARFVVEDEAATRDTVDSAALTDATWRVLAGRRDAGATIAIFKDTTKVSASDDTDGNAITNDYDLTVGVNANGLSLGAYRGAISSAGLFIDRALTDDQVAALVTAVTP